MEGHFHLCGKIKETQQYLFSELVTKHLHGIMLIAMDIWILGAEETPIFMEIKTLLLKTKQKYVYICMYLIPTYLGTKHPKSIWLEQLSRV